MNLQQFKASFQENLEAIHQLLSTAPSAANRMAALNAERANKPRQIKKNTGKQASIAISNQQQQEEEQEQDQEQEQEQQQAIKQKKIEDWMKRARAKARLPSPPAGLGTLTREMCVENYGENSTYLKIWDKCVGPAILKVPIATKIRYISTVAWQRIVANNSAFADGLSLDHLPAGFVLWQEGSKLYLDYDSTLVDKTPDYPLRVKINPIIKTTQIIPNEEAIQGLMRGLGDRAQVHYEKLFQALSRAQLTELAMIANTIDIESCLLLINALDQLKNANRLNKTIELLGLISPRFLQQSPIDLQELHDLIKALEQINRFNDAEFIWWSSLSAQHINHAHHDTLPTLVKASAFFYNELKKIDPEIELPHDCGIKKVCHMGLTLERVLTIISQSINPDQQIQILQELNLGMEGAAYYFANNRFVRANGEMKLLPVNEMEQLKEQYPNEIKIYADLHTLSPNLHDIHSLVLYKSYLCPRVGSRQINGEERPVYHVDLPMWKGLAVAQRRTEIQFGMGDQTSYYYYEYTFYHFASGEADKAPIDRALGAGGFTRETARQPLENRDLMAESLKAYELRSELNICHFHPVQDIQTMLDEPATMEISLLRYLGQQPWILGDDSLGYYHRLFTTIKNCSTIKPYDQRQLAAFMAYVGSGKRGALVDQSEELDRMLITLGSENEDKGESIAQFITCCRVISRQHDDQEKDRFRPLLSETVAIYTLLNPSKEIRVSDEKIIRDLIFHAGMYFLRNQTPKETPIINLSKNHQASFAQIFKIFHSLKACQTRKEVIQKIGEGKTANLFSQPLIIKNLQGFYLENQGNTPSLETLKSVHVKLLRQHLMFMVMFPTLSRVIALLNPLSLDENALTTLENEFNRTESTRKLLLDFNAATYRSKYSNDTTLDTLLNFLRGNDHSEEKLQTTFPDLRFANAKMDINLELIRSLDDLSSNLQDVLASDQIREKVTSDERVKINGVLHKISEAEEPETKLPFYGELIDAIIGVHAIGGNPIQKTLALTLVNKFILPSFRASLIEPLFCTVTSLGLAEEQAKTLNAYWEKSVPGLQLNAGAVSIGADFVLDLNALTLKIKSANRILQELAQNKSLLKRTRLGQLVEQIIAHEINSTSETICVLIKLLANIRAVSISGLFNKLASSSVKQNPGRNKNIQSGLTTLITLSDPPLPASAVNALIDFIFESCAQDAGQFITALVKLYRPQLEQGQLESLKQVLNYAKQFSFELKKITTMLEMLGTQHRFDSIQEIFKQAKLSPDLLLQLLNLNRQVKHQHTQSTIDILLKSLSVDSSTATTTTLQQAFGLLLTHLTDENNAKEILFLYQKKPYFGFKALQEHLQSKTYADMQATVTAFDQDPKGDRATALRHQFDILRVHSVAEGLVEFKSNRPISSDHANILKESFFYVNEIGHRIPPRSKFVNQPISKLGRQSLLAYFKQLRDALTRQVSEQEKSLYRLELLAVLREVMYRTTGTIFPYSTQIISVINDLIYHQGNVSSQVKTGEGKTIITCLKATMLWAQPGHTVDVCTSNLELAAQALREFQTFYDYLDIPVAVVDKDSPDRTFKFEGINFSDASNFSLYQSRVKFAQNSEWAEMMKKNPKPIIDLVLDETDVPVLDEYTTSYNFSAPLGDTSNSDLNPNEALYPVINEFIKTDEFRDPKISRQGDITRCREYFKKKNIALNVNDAQIDIWLDSAVIASRLKEDKDFAVVKTSTVVGRNEIKIREAQIIINDRPQPGAKWTNGVHQFLHARLSEEHNKTDDPFMIEPELSIVDTASSKSFIQDHLATGGRYLGMTGTLGSATELVAYEDYQATLYRVPSHRVNRLVKLQPISASHEAGFIYNLFGWDFMGQLKKVILDSKTNRQSQPILIVTPNIEKVHLYEKLLKDFFRSQKINYQCVTGTQEESEESCVKKAGQQNMVTISTPMLGRGTDIKTKHAHGLFTICTFIPDPRIEEQIYGRPARNGQIGQYLHLYDYDSEYNQLADLGSVHHGQHESAIESARKARLAQAELRRLYAQMTSECMQVYLSRFDNDLLLIDNTDSAKLQSLQTKRYLFITQVKTQSDALIDQLRDKGINPFFPTFSRESLLVTTHLVEACNQLREYAKELYDSLAYNSPGPAAQSRSASAILSEVSGLKECVNLSLLGYPLDPSSDEAMLRQFVLALVAGFDQYHSTQIELYKNDPAANTHLDRLSSAADEINKLSYEISLKRLDALKREIGTVINSLSNTEPLYLRALTQQFIEPLINALIKLKSDVFKPLINLLSLVLLADHFRAGWLPHLSLQTKNTFLALTQPFIKNQLIEKLRAYKTAHPELLREIRICDHFIRELLSNKDITRIDFSDQALRQGESSMLSGIYYSFRQPDSALLAIIGSAKKYQQEIMTVPDGPGVGNEKKLILF